MFIYFTFILCCIAGTYNAPETISIPNEQLFLSCIELSFKYNNSEKLFTIDIPDWGKKEYDVSNYYSTYLHNHQHINEN